MDSPFDRNEHGIWCPSCGHLIASSWQADDEDFVEPEMCKVCGYPDDIEAMADYHVGPQ